LTAYCPSTLYHATLAVINDAYTPAAPILTNIHSSYAVIWMQVTAISDIGFHAT